MYRRRLGSFCRIHFSRINFRAPMTWAWDEYMPPLLLLRDHLKGAS